MRVCIVNLNTGLVENIVEMGLMPPGPINPATGQPRYAEAKEAPEGYAFIPSDEGEIGFKYVGGLFLRAVDSASGVSPVVKLDNK